MYRRSAGASALRTERAIGGEGKSMSPREASAKITAFPDLKPATRRELLGGEVGSQFDLHDRMFAFFGNGDIFLHSTSTTGSGIPETWKPCSPATARLPRSDRKSTRLNSSHRCI